MSGNHSVLIIFSILTLLILKNHYFSLFNNSSKSKPSKSGRHPTAGPINPFISPSPTPATHVDLIPAFLVGALFASLCIIPAVVKFPSFLPDLFQSTLVFTRRCFSTILLRNGHPAAPPPTQHQQHQSLTAPDPPAHLEDRQLSTAIVPVLSNGIGASILHTLPIFAYSSTRPPTFGKGTTGRCCICLSGFVSNQVIRWLPGCSHFFHRKCIDKWLNSHKTCPCCRANIEDVDNGGADQIITSRDAGAIVPVNWVPRASADHHHQAVVESRSTLHDPYQRGVATTEGDYQLVATTTARRRAPAANINGSVGRVITRPGFQRPRTSTEGRIVSVGS